MTATTESFTGWLGQARLSDDQLTPLQRGALQAAFAFRQRCGHDYYSTRLLSHFLLHAGTGLKVGGQVTAPIDRDRVAELVRAARAAWQSDRQP